MIALFIFNNDVLFSQNEPNFYEIKQRLEEELKNPEKDENGVVNKKKEDGKQAKFRRWYNLWRYRIGPNGEMDVASKELIKLGYFRALEFVRLKIRRYELLWR